MKYNIIQHMNKRYRVTIALMLAALLAGGSAMAQGVKIHGSVFGGGNGSDDIQKVEEGKVKGNTKVDISDGTVTLNVYGGGNQGNVEGNTEVNICAMENSSGVYEAMNAGENGVTIGGDVYGGGKGSDANFFCNKAMVGNDGDGAGEDPGSDENKDKGTAVRIGNGTINGNVFGGGEVGRVEWNTQVTIGYGDGGNNASKPYIKKDVFGAGKGVSTHGFSALVRGNSTVTIGGDAQIGNNVYGGGQIATVGRYVVINSRPTKPASGGLCTVNISGHANIGAEANAEGDVFGAGKGVLPYEGWGNDTPWSMVADGSHNDYPAKSASTDAKADYFVFIQTLALASDTEVSIGGNVTVKGSVYGGSENGFLQRHTQVTIQGSSEIGTTSGETDVDGNIFGGGRGDDSVEGYAEAGKVKGNTNVTINGGIMHGTVYGGGEMGYTVGSATVNILNGTINHDVYGGGALANTNTGNGTTNTDNEIAYVQVPGLTAGTSSVEGLYQNTYVTTPDTKPVANKQYYTADGTPITGTLAANPHDAGYCEWSETVYAESHGTAQPGKIYYTLTHPTTVNLFGGLIKGDAYGGGLGRLEKTGENAVAAVEAEVGGDVTVNLGNPTEADVDDAIATAFELSTTSGTIGQTTYTGIANSGRIFGCNNLNGSPKGAVTVNVYRTTALTNAGDVKAKPTPKMAHDDATDTNPGTYELAAVYGGGNLAMYDPTNAETPATVNIYGCGLTSIKQVYGGGNAAPVPGSEVMVEGTYEIYQVFGGGNGKDIIQKNGTWMENPGADVGIKSYTGTTPNYYGDYSAENSKIGVAKVSVLGGTIHYVFGGSNTKGDVVKNSWLVLGSENIQGCEYNVGKAYGGANDAPMSGDIVIEMGCTEGLDVIYGGARNADVNGNIVLNITGGHFGKVFGGNDNGGAVQGSITVNIEERSCLPIEIDELYGGGENAPYSIYGYKKDANDNIIKDENSRPTVLKAGDEGALATPYKNPQVNIISATRIGKVFGGGYGETAIMVGDPHVNINMTQGTIDGKYEYRTGISDSRYNVNSEGYSYRDANDNPLVLTSTDQTASSYPKTLKLGSVGDVFGGGNAAKVIGDTYISIGTGEWLNRNEERVMLGTTSTITEPTTFTYNTDSKKWSYEGKDANNNTVTVSIDDTPTPSRNAAPITGNVYGGGNLADVTGSTQVVICATEGTGGTYQNVTTGTANVSIAENVYGGGNGDANDVAKALVSGNTTIIMGGGSVEKSVYGGGRLAQVGGNANINVNGGTIGKDREGNAEPYTYWGGAEYGNIYGAGQGSESGVGFGLVKGNTNINITDGTIYHNIYGGGAFGSVGTYTYTDDVITGYNTFDNENKPLTGKASITITGGTIGTDGHNNGMVFGSSRGDIDAPNAIHDKLAWVYDTEVTIGTANDETDGPTIHGSLYGGGENGHVYHDAKVMMYSGTVGDTLNYYAYRGNVYGGGCGTDLYYTTAIPTGHTAHDGKGDKFNPKAGIVMGDATVEINGGSVANNVYGAGSMGKVEGSTNVTINTDGKIGVDGTHDDGNVYGAARGEQNLKENHLIPDNDDASNYSTVTNSSVTLTKGRVKGSLYGGGKAGEVTGAVTVNLNGGTVEHDAYGGGALAKTNTAYHATNHPDYITTVNLGDANAGTEIKGDLYGGGLGDLASKGDGHSDVAADVRGPITVTVTKGLATNVFGCNNINGSPQNTVTVNINGTNAVTANRPKPIFNVYGGGNQANYTYTDPDNTQNLKVNITGGIMEYVFGGGLSADVAGGIDVTVSGGTVLEDVYGGGALANTNTANWENGTWKDQSKGTYYAEVKHLKIGESSVVGYYTRTGDGSNEHPYVYSAYPLTEGTAAANTTYCKKIENFLVVAAENTLYETNVILEGGEVGNAYGGGLGRLGKGTHYDQTECNSYNNTELTGALNSTNALTADQAKAYNAKLSGAIAAGAILTVVQTQAVNSVLHTNYVAGDAITDTDAANYNATLANSKAAGATLSDAEANAYNAKLSGARTTSDWKINPTEGTGNVKAMVYGDVKVRVDGTAFSDEVTFINGGSENVANHGRVFGGNNLNGTPKGKVTVIVNSTKRTDGTNHVKGEFEIQGVYGGGNLADYVPQTYFDNTQDIHIEFGQKSQVIINGCNATSINKVYGGGNAASVPFTDVTINGAFEIGYAFGGGNGGDKVNYGAENGNEWVTNPGANVPGYTNVMLRGGTIGQAFGGSDTKGTVGGTDVKQETTPDCPLHIVNLYGAGNGDEANSDGDINITVSACGEGSEIQNVFGGSYKANIKGSVTLNITSGIFTSVYGGNDRMGSIGGPIIVNIEETDECEKPIIIQNLYGGCYQTAYPGVGAQDKDGNPYTSGNITVNVKSATRIDRIFGGSENGLVTGNTTVNINMVEGSQSGQPGVAVPDYYVNPASRPSNVKNVVEGGKIEVYGLVTNADVLEDPTKERSSVVGYFTKNASYSQATGTAQSGTTYYEKTTSPYYPIPSEEITVGETNVSNYYTRKDYQQATGNAEANVTYYSLSGGEYTIVENITEGQDVSNYYIKAVSYTPATGTAAQGITYYRQNDVYNPVTVADGADVTSYWTIVSEEYPNATGLAVAGVTYYKSSVKGDIDTGIGTIGDVFGGGNRGNVSGNATVNIVTEPTVTMISKNNTEYTVQGAHITGDVYGGGYLADVLSNTYVNICAKENKAVAEGTEKVTIAGNVYGGGKGADDNFFCDKGMVGMNNANNGTQGDDDRGTHVHIGNGTVNGSVYGGGEVGRVEFHSIVTIGLTPETGKTSTPEILGNVFGGGKGVETHGYAALLRGHTNVTVQENAKVRNSVYGGGEIATIGRFWIKNVNNISIENGDTVPLQGAPIAPGDFPNGMPYALKDGGTCTVNILGNAEIGPTTQMTMPQFEGNVFGAGKGFLPKVYDYTADNDAHRPKRIAVGGNDYFKDEAAYMVFIETQALVNETHVTINGNAFVKGSVYGGSENGRVLNDTYVTIAGGQIGAGNGVVDTDGHPRRYTTDEWASTSLAECASWTYDKTKGEPYDPFAKDNGDYDYNLSNFSIIPTADRITSANGGKPTATDGHTYYGNVFGGGCGKDPYKPGKWHRKAGAVGGNTTVTITGGHILTSLYGGNEMTDVGTYTNDKNKEPIDPVSGGKCTINMTGGTLGVPRTLAQIAAHPVTCYLFGAGKGDTRTFFNTWTNVINTEVNITGTARIYGSVFGGGEDGHIINDAEVNIGNVSIDLNYDGDKTDAGETFTASSLKIGTWGTSYVDGNVFGGGRGFTGDALTAGSTGGNVRVNISAGTMLGSIYGGGRLASVGIAFTSPDADLYGQLVDDTDDNKNNVIDDSEKHGHIKIDISGGTIGGGIAGTDADKTAGYFDTRYSGNVFGGSMGRITLLNGSRNPLWPKLAVVKEATINISGGEIMNSVYGGSEYGIVRDKATVNVLPNATAANSPVIWGNVYGGGYGSDDETPTLITAGDYDTGTHYIFTPMIWTGCVAGDTEVNISGGTMKKNIYGGGELASVGLINCNVEEDDENGDIIIGTKKYRYTAMIKHDVEGTGSDEKAYRFALSWPYEFNYISGNPTTGYIGGKSSVTISGGTIGIENDTENTGYIFGGGKGKVWFGATENTFEDISGQRYKEAFCANVRETHVTIKEGANVRTVYGGAEDGHVEENTNVIINGGTITHSVFGGGKGTSTFKSTLLDATEGSNQGKPKIDPDNTSNYLVEDVYSWTAGKVYGNTNVTMNGGNVGWFIYGGGNLASVGKGNYAGGKDDYSQAGYGELPSANGNLWTTSYTAQNPTKDMAYYFLNSGIAKVNIYGGKVGSGTVGFESDGIPRGSVFGGSRGKAAKTARLSPRYKYVPDFFLGYVNKTEVKIGKSSSDFTGETAATDYANYAGPTIYGSVYAGGQDGHVRNSTELKVYKANIKVQDNDDAGRSGHIFGAGSGIGKYTDGNKQKLHYGSGSVTCTTFVEVNDDAHIEGNVYGGGAMATVGPPKIPVDRPDDEQKEVTSSSTHKSCSYTQVDINGGSIGGSVFGASRGPSVSFYADNFKTPTNNLTEIYNSDQYATSIWSTVNINGGEITGNVYGGGEGGCVKNDIKVNLNGGKITNDAYGGGKGHKYIAADVGGNVTLELNKNVATLAQNQNYQKGCIVKRIYGCNDVNGTPKGHVLVHVFATQHPDKQNIHDKYAQYGNVTTYNAASDLTAFATAVGMTETERTPYETAITQAADADTKAAKIEEYRNAISLKKYDVEVVYGGGNLAAYEPTDASSTVEATKEAARTEVIIDGCELTSIKQVYGGSNAASTPATLVRVNEAYEIDELFGGGNGKDMYQDPKDGLWYKNPGANVGYKDFTVKGNESGADKNNAISQTDDPLYDTAEKRLAATSLHYGSGIANIMVTGGRIHLAYGGSNSRGNIRTKATSLYQESGTCALDIDKSYGAGKDAQTDAQVVLNMDCVTNMDQLFGGSTNADVNNDIYLRVTNGTYNQVFGGNDTNGAIHGSITVEIEENGCTPIQIKELYAGGYLAPYSVYGYKKDDNGRLIPLQADDEDAETKKLDPHINVISATKIGDIYGGGYKAEVVGNPHINVNMTTGKVNLKKVEVKLIGGVYKDDDGNTYNSQYVFEEGSDPKKYYVYADGANVSYDSTVEGNVQTETTNEGTNYYHTQTTGYIGNIFGGGNEADIWGNTYIDIGTGKWIKRTRDPQTGKVSETDANHNVIEETLTRNKAELLVADGETKPYFGNFGLGGGYVFGGGNQGIVKGNTYITMGNGATVGNSIFGGGNLGSVGTFTGDADHRNYSFKDTDGNANGTDDTKNTGICNVTITGGTVGPADPTETVPGNVFGGGRGSDTDYYCEEAMAYGTNISITNGIVNGNIYGGGKIARLEHNASVTIGIEESETSSPEIMGDVFGAGKGLETHGYSALVRGNPSVTVQGKAKVRGSVYGGGEIASVARYKVENGSPVAVDDPNSGTCTVIVRDDAEIGPDDMQMKKTDGSAPDDKGHVFGAGKGVLPKVYDYVSENNYTGEGTYQIDAHRPKRMLAVNTPLSTGSTSENSGDNNIWEYFGSDDTYHAFIETLALSSNTNVTIGGHAFVKGSVYGGSENGIVQYNTHVTIEDNCQIGNGYVQMDDEGKALTTKMGVNRRYTDEEWTAGHLIDPVNDGSSNGVTITGSYTTSLPECASWDYDKTDGAPYDPFATVISEGIYGYNYTGDYSVIPAEKRRMKDNTSTSEGGKPTATDGHTYYGNVYGGGSGVVPYAPGLWHRAAGQVRGNTQVDITGGHILTSVYGGNEHTDVGIYTEDSHHELTVPKSGGKCTVNMTGGTLGVPRTLAQIAAHPVTCYLFGAGKGDQRVFFNTWTNVKEVEVNITKDARIYGSVFGGGEDGHVINDVKLNIGDVKIGETTYDGENVMIGTTGTSYVDGNVFGAGRGYSGGAITAGSIGGNIEVKISDGTMLGSVYGGGRLASVGIGFNAATDASYGQFTEDVAEDVAATYYQAGDEIPAGMQVGDLKTPAIPAHSHGHITVDISGGTIGNDLEDLKDANNSHTKGGNVYGGSMGRLELLDGTTPNPLWPQLGQAKTTTVNISGTALIKSNVYGGGEMGTVRDNTNITISGGTVNRDVYGGGYGSDKIGENYNAIVETVDQENHPVFFGYNPMKWAGMVGKETNVTISGGRVKKSVYGGGEMASVGIINYTLGQWHDTKTDAEADGTVVFKNPKTNKYAAYATIVKHADANSSFALSWPYKVEYIPEYEGKTNVTITGGRIGLISAEDNDDDHPNRNPFFEKDNGDVYGGGKGIAGDFNDYLFCANVGSSEITINYPTDDDVTPENYMSSETIECVAGAVYGGAENGHVMGDTKVTLTNGLIGHSLYGGGSGKGQFTTWLTEIPEGRRSVVTSGGSGTAPATQTNAQGETEYKATCYSITAGKVFGNTEIEMTGGRVVRNIYGGGNMGSVGKGNYAGGPDDYSTAGYGEKVSGSLWTSAEDGDNAWQFLNSGKCTVKVTGGTVGYINETNPDKSMYPLKDKQKYDASLPYGNVFGGCRGEAAPNILESPRYLYSPEFFVGYANETEVTIGTKDDSTDGPRILGSVYGGGQDGHLRRDTHVTVNSGEIGLPFSDNYRTIFGKTSTTTLNDELDNLQWLARGNVYGAGSGIGKYQYDFNYDGDFGDVVDYTTPGDNGRTSRLNEEDNSASAGSVTRFTQVDIYGGTIHRNVYGGGSMASVGAPMIGQGYLPYRKGDTTNGVGKQSLNQVNIAGKIGTPTNYNPVYGGEVYGASRGIDANNTSMATSIWTEVNLLPGAYVQGNVFGGGDNGMVKQDAEVNVGTPWTATIEAGNIPLTGGSKKITITTKDKWTATSNVDWLIINPSNGEGNGEITVTAPAAGAAREAKVTITGTGRSQTFTVKQE